MAKRKLLLFRRCHVCGATIESEGESAKVCPECGKYLTPFFFCDEKKLTELPASEPDRKEKNFHRPVIGIIVAW